MAVRITLALIHRNREFIARHRPHVKFRIMIASRWHIKRILHRAFDGTDKFIGLSL